MKKGKVWINRLMANRPITTDRRGEWDILLNCIKKSPALPDFSFVCKWQNGSVLVVRFFRNGMYASVSGAVFCVWGMAAAWRVSGLTKFPDRGCFRPVCLCRGCFDRPVRNVCISKKRHQTPFCGARCRVFCS